MQTQGMDSFGVFFFMLSLIVYIAAVVTLVKKMLN